MISISPQRYWSFIAREPLHKTFKTHLSVTEANVNKSPDMSKMSLNEISLFFSAVKVALHINFLSVNIHLFTRTQLKTKRNSSMPPELFSGKGVLKICSKFTGEHRCRSVISKKVLCNFVKILL